MEQKQRLELTWPGKDKFLLSPKDDEGKPVFVERGHPAAAEVRLADVGDKFGTDPQRNLLFSGDGFDMLRVLAESPDYRDDYRGKVKLIYIDPPFNTGETFKQYDDWLEHATWLSFMRERLLVARELLSEEGSIWVHLDDAEVHRMRLLLDEVFGGDNFVSTVIWQKAYSPKNARQISTDHDYILVYSKSSGGWKPVMLPRTEKMNAAYKNPDSDPRGPWKAGDMVANKPYSLGLYSVVAPSGRVIEGPPEGRYWRYSEESFNRLNAENRIWWGKDGNNQPAYKRFLSDVGGRKPQTLWLHEEVGHNDGAKRESRALFGGSFFDTPKPEAFMERVIHIATDENDIVLDFFGGSGTTAAVAHKMGRRWVLGEIEESTIKDFIQPRLTQVVSGDDQGGISKAVGWAGGGGFQTVIIAPTMYEVIKIDPADDGIGEVVLADWATNGRFSRAVAQQLGFKWQRNAAPFCGKNNRTRLAVFDGSVGMDEVRHVVAALSENELVSIVAKMVMPDAESLLSELSPGSQIQKAPRDILSVVKVRTDERIEARRSQIEATHTRKEA